MAKTTKQGERVWYMESYDRACIALNVLANGEIRDLAFFRGKTPRYAAQVTEAAAADYPGTAAAEAYRCVVKDWEEEARQLRKEADNTEYTARLARLNSGRDVRDLAEANEAGA